MLKIFKRKINIILCLVSGIVLSQLVAVKTTHAFWSELISGGGNLAGAVLYLILGAIIQGVAWIVGKLLGVLTSILISVAQYGDFINAGVVTLGWPIVRDLCNMFFVLILLVIAFATILKIENYNAKKLLPKLLIMAVLINFSKTICGLAIDFSQVVMLTFVNAFSAAGAGNLYEAFGIGKIFEFFSPQTTAALKVWETQDPNAMSIFGSLLLGFIFLLITLVVVGIYTIVLSFRIVMLWILIILSPLAFLASAFPAGAKYASQWWGEFTKYLIVGPVMAFFFWLTLVVFGTTASIADIDKLKGGAEINDVLVAGLTEAGSVDNMMKFIVATCLMLGGLMVAQQLGVAGGGMAGGFVGKVKGWGIGASYKLPIKSADWLQRKASMSKWAEKAGVKGFDLAPTRMYKRITEGMADEKRLEIDKMGSAAGESMTKGGFRGLLSSLSSPDFAKEVLDGPFALRGIKRVWQGGVDMYSNTLKRASEHDAQANAAQTMTEFVGKGYDNERLEREFKKEDSYKKLKDTVGEEKADEYFDKVKGFDKVALNKEIGERRGSSQRHRKDAAKYKIASATGDKAFWGGIMEAKSKASENAEEAIAESFVGAVEKNDQELAAALVLKSGEVNGYNTLLAKMGYSSVHAGFTEKEAEELNKTEEGKKHYQQFRGGHDMFRDIFVKKFGMGNERSFSVEDELSETCLAHGHLYGAKTIANKDGRRIQRSAKEQKEATLTEIKKGDAEGLVRKYQKAGFGGHDANGKWLSSDLGQETMLTYWKSVAKQIEINRWNQSASEEMGKKEEVKKIRDLFDKMAVAIGNKQAAIEMFGTAKVGDNNNGTIEDFFNRVEQYSKVGGPEMNKIMAAARAGEKYELKNVATKKETKNTKQDKNESDDLTKLAEEARKKRNDRFSGRS
ncbi:hypothetical protein KKH38_01785 [Patescibacteria group bacterium]|nr:hypothetical protein [Patescibacteria group bacterium]MBU4601318.1 hypothetical protein [Patescibacteria group bacterium]MCG2698627.1 hypothetical protein [Candidatus Parcubacteria bacterium]